MKKLMKKLILTLIFCLVCSIASAGMMENLAAVAKKKVAPGGITYLIDEDFEGTGTPSGWATSGTITFDYDNGGDTSLQIHYLRQFRVLLPMLIQKFPLSRHRLASQPKHTVLRLLLLYYTQQHPHVV